MGRRMISRRFAEWTALALACLLWPATVPASEVLTFRPVPRESTAHFEKIKIVRHTPAPDPTDTMSFGESPPDAPEQPNPPVAVVDRTGGIMKIGSDIRVGPSEVIHGDLSSVNGDITIEGHVEGDVVAMRGDVDLMSTARVDGDVVCLGGQLTEEPGAQVKGQKVTAGHSGAWSIRDRGDRGDRRDGEDGDSPGGRRRADRVAGSLVWLLILTLLGWLFVRVGAGRTVAAVELINRSPGLSLGIGALIWALIIPSLIALVLVVALLCITIIGIPLALAALVGYALFLSVLTIWGYIVAATILGGRLSRAAQDGALSGVPPSAHPAGVGGAALPGVAGTGVSDTVSLTRRMLIGVGVLMGSIVLGHLLRATGLGPLHGLGTLLLVLGIIASSLATTIGAGALLLSEIAIGTFQVIWHGRRFGKLRGTAVPPGASHAAATESTVVSTPGASAPWPPMPPMPPQPAPPEAFRPRVDPGIGGEPTGASPPQDPQPPIG